MADSNAGSSAGGENPVQMLNAVRVIPPNDDPKWPLWRYVQKVAKTGGGKGGNAKIICRLCNRDITGSYSRVKTHLLKLGDGGVKPCPKVTIDVLIQLKSEQDKADASSNTPLNIPLPTDGNGGGRKRKASAIEASFDVDTRSKLDALIARMFYTAGLPFNLARNPWFRQAFMFAANSKLGGYVPPSYNKIRTSLLVQEKTQVERMLQPIKSTWSSKGVSIVSDGWSDPQRRPLLNFMAVTEDGPMFLRAINTEGKIKTKEYIFQRMLETIDLIGAGNIVQVVTDNASNCRGAGLMVEQKYPHIFWTPCVVHTLNLALKSIGAARNEEDPEYEHCNWINEVSSDAQQIRNFIMNHSMRLSMFNEFSKLKLLSIAETRFASQIVMLKRFREIKDALTLLVVSPKWSDYRDDNQGRAQFVKDKVLSDLWWDKVKYILDFSEPIYSMIRAADTDKPCLHLIYEMWDSMIEKVKTIIYRHEGKEEYEHSPFYDIVDKILQSRWLKNNTPLHCLAHSLNPKYYTQAWLAEVEGREAPHVDEEISTERNKCFRRMFGDGPELHKIKQQFGNFSLFAAGFSSFDSIEDRTYLEPKIWWGIHGNSAPELQKLALKLLGQPSSSSCAERNWSTYGLIHSTARNRLNPGRAEDLVFVHQNLRLISRKSSEYSSGPTRFWDIGGDSHDIFGGGADFLQHAVLSLDEPELEAMLDDLQAE
ncbi:hypothetical protein ACQ4PT_071726 [Festuca glaucescens]